MELAAHRIEGGSPTLQAGAGRPTPDRIREGILHPDEDARRTAVRYFAGSFSNDPAVMPQVICAIERYGPEAAFALLDAELPQTAETIDWLLNQLSRASGNIEYRRLLSSTLAAADVSLLAPRWDEIQNARGLVKSALKQIKRRLALIGEDPHALWEQLEALCRRLLGIDYAAGDEMSLGYDLVEAVARHGDLARERCETILQQEIDP